MLLFKNYAYKCFQNQIYKFYSRQYAQGSCASKNVIDKYISESWWDNVKLIERFKRNVRIAPDRIAVDPRTKRVDRALLSS